jgi:alanine-glyoxylate transaminase/serine-glyoxylate transaminase/serine-pyruvate transaminase
MDEVQQGLRYLFQTSSPYTLCVSGTGHAGMEAAIANLVEPGETVIVGNKGIWVSFITKLPYFLMSPMQNT